MKKAHRIVWAFRLVLVSQLVCPKREPAVDFVADVLIELRMLVETQRSVDLRTLPRFGFVNVDLNMVVIHADSQLKILFHNSFLLSKIRNPSVRNHFLYGRLALSLHKSAKRRVVLVCFFQLRSGPMCCTSFAFGYEVHHSGQDLPESGVTAFGLVLHGLEEVHNSFSLVQFIKRHFSVVDNSRVQYGVLIEDDDTMMGRNRISHE